MPQSTLDSRARRAAEKAGLAVRKSRARTISADNLGEYMLIATPEGTTWLPAHGTTLPPSR
jgi:hypothetical protein